MCHLFETQSILQQFVDFTHQRVDQRFPSEEIELQRCAWLWFFVFSLTCIQGVQKEGYRNFKS